MNLKLTFIVESGIASHVLFTKGEFFINNSIRKAHISQVFGFPDNIFQVKRNEG